MATNTKTIILFGKKIEVELEKDKEEEKKKALPRPIPFFIVNKTLTDSDCSKTQGRLLIKNSSKLFDSLTTLERKMLTNSKEGIRVTAVDNQGIKYKLNLSMWPSLNRLVINKGWNKVLRANMLAEFDKIQLACYRHYKAGLYFLLNFYERAKINTKNDDDDK